MNCPHCNIPLLMADRKGIEIDYCGQCRGIWLDRGELDKIIELTVNERFADKARSHSQASGGYTSGDYASRQSGADAYRGNASHYQRKSSHNTYHQPYYKYKKKKTLLGELFDVFD